MKNQCKLKKKKTCYKIRQLVNIRGKLCPQNSSKINLTNKEGKLNMIPEKYYWLTTTSKQVDKTLNKDCLIWNA